MECFVNIFSLYFDVQFDEPETSANAYTNSSRRSLLLLLLLFIIIIIVPTYYCIVLVEVFKVE